MGEMATWSRVCATLAAAGALAGCATLKAAPPSTLGRSCHEPAGWAPAAASQQVSLDSLDFAAFGRAERGWMIYAAAAAQEIGVPCPPATPAFAAGLAAWQAARGLPASGVMDPATFEALKAVWQDRRPFVALRARDVCPDPPPERTLALARPLETAGKPVRLRRRALHAYRAMVAAARRAVPQAAADPELLRIFSGYRSPAYDDERCAREGNCDGVARAQCSAHRTGLALDLMLGAAPGFAVDSSEDANRLHQAGGPAYLWLVANAGRFGFVNYAFEPWHWEWTGEPVVHPSF